MGLRNSKLRQWRLLKSGIQVFSIQMVAVVSYSDAHCTLKKRGFEGGGPPRLPTEICHVFVTCLFCFFQVETKRASLLTELDKYHATCETLRRTTSAIKEHRARFSQRNLCDLMQQSSIADEEQSDACAENFLAGNCDDVEQFVSDYIKVRSDHHKKKVAVERIGRSHR